MPVTRPLYQRIIQQNYFGPGNPIDDAPVVNSADAVARDHDILYQAIQESDLTSDEHFNQVQEADKTAVNSFLVNSVSDIQNGEVSSGLLNLVGAGSLQAKKTFESTLGRAVYPPMGDRIHKRKGVTEKPDEAAGGKVLFLDRAQKGNLKAAEKKLEAIKAGTHKKEKGPEAIARQQAIVDRLRGERQQWAPAVQYHKEAADQRNLIKLIDDYNANDNGQEPVANNNLPDSPPPSVQNELGPDTLGGAGPGYHAAPMETDNNIPDDNPLDLPDELLNDPFGLLSNNLPPNTAVNQTDEERAMSMLKSDFSLADTMDNVTQVIKPPELRYDNGDIVITQSQLFYSWGYNFGALDITDANDSTYKQKFLMTPLAYVPVDYLPFYMSKAQYDDLPGESWVKEVKCKVTPWGSRVSFNTQSELAKPATAQHVVVGMSAIGLNKHPEFNWANRDVTEKDTMVIDTHAKIDPTKWTKKLWGVNTSGLFDTIPSCFGAIRQLDSYGGPVVDNYVAASAGPPAVSEYKPTGWPSLDHKVNSFAFDAFKGKPIINYSYKPEFGILKMKPRLGQLVRSENGNITWARHGNDNTYFMTSGVNVSGNATNPVGPSATITQASYWSRDIYIKSDYLKYETMIESGHCRFRAGHQGEPAALQPQLHIGIKPVQANSPGVSVGFVCAAAYWQIDREIRIGVNFGSAFNFTIARPLNINEGFSAGNVDDMYHMQGTVQGHIPLTDPYS